ncbi:hypothetical protein [uncultured Kriegella sp.]|uniref:hypothetical protein n=1 Tax=uncultured Kriegella sp. TaxID=1798910 RepID=UPI0030DAA5D7|tara:strand:- start:71953 stop:73206 length:1254 start_codon:yes stop_codon:yes gene_type:complete
MIGLKEVKGRRLIILQIVLLNLIFLNAEAQEKILLRDVDFSSEIKDFKRSSLLILMVETPEKEKLNTIKSTFQAIEISDKFNDHSLDTNFITLDEEAKDHSARIIEKLDEAAVARKMVAKWFGRNEKGTFSLNLVKQRGLYNASAFDREIAEKTIRGNAMLEDAGEHLIANTFVIVNDYKYTNKEEIGEKGKEVLNIAAMFGSKAANSTTTLAADVLAKGYVIKTTSYLFRLIWDKETAGQFYGELWVTDENYNEDAVDAFDKADFFKLEYLGQQDAWADVQSTKYTSKSDEELIERATIKATNSAISKLERKFEVFRTKTPLISIDPLAAKIGTKEDLAKGDKFEVLEQILLENGSINYEKVTEITVDHNQIWDNSYLPEEANTESAQPYTVFKGNAKKLYPGMLIRFKKNQNIFK